MFHSLQDTHSGRFEVIKGIKFTRREIDILACILAGRGAKKIASLLSISPKTVEIHTHNIMLKLSCNSRERVIDFIEKSGQAPVLKQHYAGLLFKENFEQCLKSISVMTGKDKPTCHIVYWEKKDTASTFLHQLEDHLNLAGIKTVLHKSEENIFDIRLILNGEFQDVNHTLYFVPKELVEELHASHKIREISKFFQKNKKKQSFFTFVSLTENFSSELTEELYDVNYVEFRENYYLSFFEILKGIYPSINFDKTLSEIRKQYELSYGISETLFLEEKRDTSQKKIVHRNNIFNFLQKKKKWLLGGGGVFLIPICILLLTFKGNNTNPNNWNQNIKIIRSDLILPTESVFLNRSELITQIDNKFKGQDGIQTVALVGIGGAGKTTLARQYAHQQKASIVWEINAETRETLKRSFENLAYNLSKTEEDQRILRVLQEIKNPTEKEEKIIQFVKERLKLQSNWFLIYDGVEKLTEFQRYFPQDFDTWGRGKIILTTRDRNIQNNKSVNAHIEIGELDEPQKLALFVKIVNNGTTFPFTVAQNEETKKFLEKLPPFPLDVSIAAYYLKVTNVPYNKYLESLHQYKKDFSDLQERLLKELGDYTKTRYGIITLSLQHLMSTHKDFGDLLLFISLLDSQNIPRDLLNKYKSDEVIDSFIYHLKKYSLITNEERPATNSISTFSVHRSTQAISLNYLIKILNLEKNIPLIQAISSTLENYADNIIHEENLSKMKSIVSHCEVFLNHSDLWNDITKASIEGVLGGIYFHLAHYTKARKTLEDSLVRLNSYESENYIRAARALTHLGNVYRELGEYDKAKNYLEEGLNIYKKHLPKNHIKTTQAIVSLGNVYRNLKDYKKAKDLFEQSLVIHKKHFPENEIGIARLLSYLGNINRILGENEKAKDLLEQSLIIYKKRFPENHLGMARSLIYLANVYKNLGDYEKARSLLEQNFRIYKEYFSEDHLDVAWIFVYLGNIYMELGNYEKAKSLFEKGFIIHKKGFSDSQLDIAWIMTYLGNAYRELGNYQKARDLLEQSLKIYKKSFSENHLDVAWAGTILANVYNIIGGYEKARDLLQKSLIIYKNYLPDHHIDVAYAKVYLGDVYRNLGDYENAKSLFEQSLATYKKSFKENSVKIAWIYVHLGKVYEELGDYEKAKGLFEKSVVAYEKHYGKDHIETARVLKSLGQVYLLKDHTETAENLIKKSLKIFEKSKHPESYMCLESLAELHIKKSINAENKGDLQQSKIFKKQAILYLNQAQKIVKTHFPKDSPHITRIQNKLKKSWPTIAFLRKHYIFNLA